MNQPQSAQASHFVLECVAGPDAGREFPVGAEPVRFGKGAAAQLSSQDDAVLESHAAFVVRDGHLYVEAPPAARVIVEGRLISGTSRVQLSDRLKLGESYWQLRVASAPSGDAGLFEVISGKVGETVGLGRLEKFSLRELFSDVMRRHTPEEAEALLACGTVHTTPALDKVESGWPKPWLFVRVAVLAIAACALFIVGLLVWHNSKFYPGLIITGAFSVPTALLVLFMELNTPRNVSTFQIVKVVVVAGGISLVLAMIMFQIPWGGSGLLRGDMVAGPAEELAKLGALLTVAFIPRFRWTLNGLLLGAAVGTGFAAFESAGYAFDALVASSTSDMFQSLALRAFTAMGGLHVAWTAMVGAALWKVRGRNPFRMSMLLQPYFLRTLFIAMALHALWNMGTETLLPQGMWLLDPLVKVAVLGTVSWTIVLAYTNDGLRQVRKARAEYVASITPPTPQQANPTSAIDGSMIWR